MTKIYELNIDKLYSQKIKRDMTLDDLNESNPELDWSEFKSGREGEIRRFVKTYNSLMDKINEGTAPKIISSIERPKEVRNRFMKIIENKFKNNNYEIINLIGKENNIEQFKQEYLLNEKNELVDKLFDAYTFSNLTTPEKKEVEPTENIKQKMTGMMLYDLFHPGENTLNEFVKAEIEKQKFELAPKQKELEGKIIKFIPNYIMAHGVQYERSDLANANYAKSN